MEATTKFSLWKLEVVKGSLGRLEKGNGNSLGYLITLGRLRIIMGKEYSFEFFHQSGQVETKDAYAAVEPLRQGEKSSGIEVAKTRNRYAQR